VLMTQVSASVNGSQWRLFKTEDEACVGRTTQAGALLRIMYLCNYLIVIDLWV